MKLGFVKTAAITPKLKTGAIEHNTKQIIDKIIEAHTLACQIALFPELAITGKELGDMAAHPHFLAQAESALKRIADATRGRDIVCFVGLPISVDSNIYNAVACVSHGMVTAITAKSALTAEEKSVYTAYTDNILDEIEVAGFIAPFYNNIIYKCANLSLAVDSSPVIDFVTHVRNGINVVLHPLSYAETYEGFDNRDNLNIAASREYAISVVSCGSGLLESSAINYLSKNKLIAECGEVLVREGANKEMGVSDIDIDKVNFIRSKNNFSFKPCKPPVMVELKLKKDNEVLDRGFERLPFVPKLSSDYERIMNMLTHALFIRVRHTHAEKLIVGVSGGLDSLVTLLVCDSFCARYEFAREDVICVTMPCFASSSKTSQNAKKIIESLEFTHRHIPINDAITAHLDDIGHDMNEDIAYENAQARERTQVLMDIANMTKGIMLGTSDLSEEALGFSTFGGDQLSMLNVISGLCKTTLRGLVAHLIKASDDDNIKEVLQSILDTPISPELKSNQSTEETVGSYEIHDFCMYHFLSSGYSPEKIYILAKKVFSDYPLSEVKETVQTFFKRFFASQFKRNATSDGVQIFDISLSDTNFKMISDFDGDIFKTW